MSSHSTINPAACEACVEHVREHLHSVPEWREDLISLMSDGTEEEENEE